MNEENYNENPNTGYDPGYGGAPNTNYQGYDQNPGNNYYGQEPSGGNRQGGNGFAIASMVLGIVSLVLFCIWEIAIPCAIAAIVLGIIQLKSRGKNGMAIAGIICGVIGMIITILAFVGALMLYNSGFYQEILNMSV